jgi:hypothetical protein
MFNFPDAPVAGDTHSEFGVEYVWDGAVWNLAGGGAMGDYVLKAGDTMNAGPLIAVSPAHFRVEGSDPAFGTVRLAGGSVDRVGMLEWHMGSGQRKAYLGWGLQHIDFKSENGNKGLFMVGGGLHWGNDSAQTDPNVFDRGICLYGYGGTSQFGFTITSGTLNYVVQNGGNQHNFRVGNESVMTVKSDGVRVPGGGLRVEGGDLNCSLAAWITGNLTVNGSIDGASGSANAAVTVAAGSSYMVCSIGTEEALSLTVAARKGGDFQEFTVNIVNSTSAHGRAVLAVTGGTVLGTKILDQVACVYSEGAYKIRVRAAVAGSITIGRTGTRPLTGRGLSGAIGSASVGDSYVYGTAGL